jgi:hypothetical protein
MSDKETRRKLKRERREEISAALDTFQASLVQSVRAADALDANYADLCLPVPKARFKVYREIIKTREANLAELSKGVMSMDFSAHPAEIQGKMKLLRETAADLHARTVADLLDGIALEPQCPSSARSV